MRLITFCSLLISCWLASAAQRPSLTDLVNQVRTEIGLDHNQYDKVYSAYEKFDKGVFGDMQKNRQHDFPGAPPSGRPGGRPDGPGMGSGNGPGHGPGMHGNPPSGKPGAGAPPSDRQQKPADLEKMMKKREQQEAKLDKTMRKIFKKEPGKYESWKKMRQRQLADIFPAPPHAPEGR